jgi:hypothetical protein
MEAREKAFDAKLAAINAEKDLQDEAVLRKYLGVPNDQPLKASDIPAIVAAVRKAAVETTEKQRGPAAQEKAGPTGNTKDDPFDKLFNPHMEEKQK